MIVYICNIRKLVILQHIIGEKNLLSFNEFGLMLVISYNFRVIANIFQYFYNSFEEAFNKLLANFNCYILFFFILLNYLFDFKSHLLATSLYQIEKRLNIHISHHLNIKYFIYCFYAIYDDIKLSLDFLPPMAL